MAGGDLQGHFTKQKLLLLCEVFKNAEIELARIRE